MQKLQVLFTTFKFNSVLYAFISFILAIGHVVLWEVGSRKIHIGRRLDCTRVCSSHVANAKLASLKISLKIHCIHKCCIIEIILICLYSISFSFFYFLFFYLLVCSEHYKFYNELFLSPPFSELICIGYVR